MESNETVIETALRQFEVIPLLDNSEAWEQRWRLTHHRYVVNKENLYGLVDDMGRIMARPQWKVMPFNLFSYKEGLFPVGKKRIFGKKEEYGYIDLDGKQVIPMQWEDAGNFSEGLAQVKSNGKWGFVDSAGKVVVPPQWDRVSDFSEGLAAVKLNGKWGYINKKGDIALPLQWKGAESFSEGLAAVELNYVGEYGRWGYIDKKGDVVLPLRWDIAGEFSRGFAEVVLYEKNIPWGEERVYPTKDPREIHRIIDKKGNVIPLARWKARCSFSEGLAAVTMHGKWGYIDRRGKLIVPLQWDDVWDFSGGLAAVKLNGKRGYINGIGEVAIPLEWDSTSPFKNGEAIVKKAGREYKIKMKYHHRPNQFI